MPVPRGHCWLCNTYGKLTKEHIPPESAFNNHPLLLRKIAEQSSQLEWTVKRSFQNGLYFHTLCGDCNNKWGGKYGRSYVDLVRRVAERIGEVSEFHQISILGVKHPLAILKQVMLQFVTVNGAKFVQANDWVAPLSVTNTVKKFRTTSVSISSHQI